MPGARLPARRPARVGRGLTSASAEAVAGLCEVALGEREDLVGRRPRTRSASPASVVERAVGARRSPSHRRTSPPRCRRARRSRASRRSPVCASTLDARRRGPDLPHVGAGGERAAQGCGPGSRPSAPPAPVQKQSRVVLPHRRATASHVRAARRAAPVEIQNSSADSSSRTGAPPTAWGWRSDR